MSVKTMSIVLATGAAALMLAAPAAAHITIDPAEGPNDGFATVGFQVPHGCEESPTTRVRIQIPPSVPSVTPGRNPFWNLQTKEGPKDEVELHGETITRGVSEVTYTAKTPLPPHELDVLTLSLKLPAGEAGDVVYFPTIQECAEGRTRWIQVPAEGESGEELESPAPSITLAAAEGGHGAAAEEGEDGAAAEGGEGQVADVDTASAAAAPAGEDDEGAPVWLAVTALVIGALGLLAGIGGLLRGRRAAG
jgi:periplasmic copper chaperone A